MGPPVGVSLYAKDIVSTIGCITLQLAITCANNAGAAPQSRTQGKLAARTTEPLLVYTNVRISRMPFI